MARERAENPSKLIYLPPMIWGQVTALLDCRSIVAFGLTCPQIRNLLRSPLSVSRFHINILGWSNIKLLEFPFEWFEPYPTLLSIGLSTNFDSKLRAFTKEDLVRFPATLRHLHLSFPDSLNDDLLAHLPKMLSTLHLDHNLRITDEGIRNLPVWLEVLHLPNNFKLSSKCIPFLPKTLKSLSFRVNEGIDASMMAQMPQLTTFRYYGASELSSTAIAALPQSLTSFGWYLSSPMGQMEVMMLPRSVIDLHVEKLETRSETFRQLPSGLKRLTIRSHTDYYNLESFLSLPPGLQYLELSSAVSLLSEECAALPRTLLSLILPSLTKANSSIFTELPRGLYILKLPTFAFVSDDDFLALPPNLHVFSCTWNEKITQNFIQKAPKKLYRLHLRAMAATTIEIENRSPRLRRPPIDDYIPLAAEFPRITRRVEMVYNISPYDHYFFDVDVPNQKLGVFDISPRSLPRPKPRANIVFFSLSSYFSR